jgi:hypothetical protein
MHNPLFHERQRMRASTWNIPRFLRSYDETLDGGVILPRGALDTVTSLAKQAADWRSPTSALRAPGRSSPSPPRSPRSSARRQPS